MTLTHSVAHSGTAGFGTDTTAASGGRSAAASGGKPATPAESDDGSPISIELLPAYGVRATFSPRSLEVLQQAARDAASEAGELVENIGDSAVAIIESAQSLVLGVAEAVTETVSETVGDSAQALLAGGEAAQAGVQQMAREAEALVSQSLSKAGDAAGAALGYGAVATLAGQALLSALA